MGEVLAWLTDNGVAVVSAIFAGLAWLAASVAANAQRRLAATEEERWRAELRHRSVAKLTVTFVDRGNAPTSVRIRNSGGGDALALRPEGDLSPTSFPREGITLPANADITLWYLIPVTHGQSRTARLIWTNPDGSDGDLDLTPHLLV